MATIKKKVKKQNELSKMNTENAILFHKFEVYLYQVKRLSESTIKSYRVDIVNFLTFIKKHDKDLVISDVSVKDVYAYMLAVERINHLPKLKRVKSSLSEFFKYMIFKGYYDNINPIEYLAIREDGLIEIKTEVSVYKRTRSFSAGFVRTVKQKEAENKRLLEESNKKRGRGRPPKDKTTTTIKKAGVKNA